MRFAKISNSKEKNGNGYKLQKFLRESNKRIPRITRKKHKTESTATSREGRHQKTNAQANDRRSRASAFERGGKGRGMDEQRDNRGQMNVIPELTATMCMLLDEISFPS